MTKAEIRKAFLEKRAALSDATWQTFSAAISNQFFSSVDLSFVRKLHVYLPMEGKKEPDTWILIDKIRREHPQVRLIVPRIDQGQLSHFFFEGLHQVKTNTWGIPEPTQGVPAEPGEIDLVIVPLLAADQTGHRVGYGKGFYDRFLKECRSNCVKIGLSLFPLIERIDDAGPHDIQLDAVVTPEAYHPFSGLATGQ
jgi:5-formyltetrahydrofolate cyclo-ligase